MKNLLPKNDKHMLYRFPHYWGELLRSEAIKIIKSHTKSPVKSYILIRNQITDDFEIHFKLFNGRANFICNHDLTTLINDAENCASRYIKFPIKNDAYEIPTLKTLSYTQIIRSVKTPEKIDLLECPTTLKTCLLNVIKDDQ